MGRVNPLKICRAYQTLLQEGRRPYSEIFEPLVQAGIAETKARTVFLLDGEALRLKLEEQCGGYLEAAARAEEFAHEIGLSTRIDEAPEDALLLLQALHETEQIPGPTWQQQLSAQLYGDSKHIGRIQTLKRIYEKWRNRLPGFGELRIKAGASLVHRITGLDLCAVTASCGQVVLLHSVAAKTGDFDFSHIHRVITCENLSPFIELSFDGCLFVYTGGYASGLVCAWIQALPNDCEWSHFGDVDVDGLRIFEDLARRVHRKGWFFPDVTTLHHPQVTPHLQDYSGDYSKLRASFSHQVKEIAEWGQKSRQRLEQEILLSHFPLSELHRRLNPARPSS